MLAEPDWRVVVTAEREGTTRLAVVTVLPPVVEVEVPVEATTRVVPGRRDRSLLLTRPT